MANISAIKLPNGTAYNIKDNNGEKSSHIHDSTSFVPIESKTYTGVIAASNDDANCYKYCIKVVPDSYGGQWDIKYRLIATIDNVSAANGNGKQESLIYISGMRNTYAAYQTWNNITNTSYRPIYYHTFRPATEAGISYGHLIGPSLRYAYNPATSTNKRNITIELLSYHGCTVTFFDSMLIYANVPGTGSTNYNNLINFDATTQGNTMSGDRNDVNYYNRTNYSSRTTAAALYRYQFCLTKRDGTLVPVNSVNNSIATNKTLTTDTFDPFGEIFFWNSTSTYSANANVGNGSFYRQYLCDLRYSFNCGGYDAAGTLTARQPLYLVCALQSDGMAKLHSSPLSMTLPSSDDGLIYIYLGRTYEDTYPYRVVLTFNHPVYYYKNGRIRELVDTAVSAESASSVAWSGVSSKPTTISGYGITDAKIASGTITLGSNTITPLTSSSTLNAAKLSGAIPSAVTATTQTAGDNSTKIATTAFVHDLFDTVPGGTVTNIATGTGLTGGPITSSGTISHADTSTQSSISASGRRYITAVALDDFGHVTGLSTGTETVTNTDTKLQVTEVTSATQYYPIVGTGTTAAERQYDTTGFKYKGTTGTTSAVGSSILELGNSTASGTAGNKQAQLVMYGTNAKKATITLAAPSADIALALPTSGGTLALVSQIPSSTDSATTGITASTTATKTTLGTAGSVTGVQSTTTTASKVTLGTAFSIAGVSGSVSVRGVKTGNNSTTTASKVTVGSHSTDYGVKSAGSGSFTSGAFNGGSGSFSATVTNHVLSFTHTHVAATHGADSHTHTAPTLGSKVPTVSASDITVPIRADADTTVPKAATAVSIPNVTGATDVPVPIKNTSATSIPNVSVASATVSITDPGHTHNI